jgi:hypothetical protein
MKKAKTAFAYVPTGSGQRLRKAIKRVMDSRLETKKANFSTTDGNQITHNNFITLTPNILVTTQGVTDPQGPTNQNCRIGDEIMLRGVSIRMMVELNERFSDVTFRLMIVKCAKGDTPTRATLFNGLSGNKMLDTVNTERYSILFQKYFKIKAPNMSVTTNSGGSSEVVSVVPPTGGGIFYGTANNYLSRATKIVKVWIPGTKFYKNGIVKYEDGSTQTKFFDFHALLYAYSSIETDQDVWNIGFVNDYVQQIYFKDG